MKKNNFLVYALFFFLLISSYGISQVVHEIEVVNFEFIPSSITVAVGDTVRWISVNVANHEHNVLADDSSFTSGLPAFAPWTFDHVFTSAGNNPYYCEPHGAPGGSGMSGVVVVTDPVSVPENEQVINEFKLNQNYPNPFNPSTKLSFVIRHTSFVSLKVYDVLGNEMK
jgi:plastocyanin